MCVVVVSFLALYTSDYFSDPCTVIVQGSASLSKSGFISTLHNVLIFLFFLLVITVLLTLTTYNLRSVLQRPVVTIEHY